MMMIEDWLMEEQHGPSFAVYPSIEDELKLNSKLTAVCFLNGNAGIHHLAVTYSESQLKFMKIELIQNLSTDHFSKGKGFNIQPICLDKHCQNNLQSAFDQIIATENKIDQPQSLQLMERQPAAESEYQSDQTNLANSSSGSTNCNSINSNGNSSSNCSSKSSSPYFPNLLQSFTATVLFNSTILLISFTISSNMKMIQHLRTNILDFPGNISQVFLHHSINQLIVSYLSPQDNSTIILLKQFTYHKNIIHNSNEDSTSSSADRQIAKFDRSTEIVIPEGVGISNDFSIVRVITTTTNNTNHTSNIGQLTHRFYLNTFHISPSKITTVIHKPLNSLLSESTNANQQKYSVLFSQTSSFMTICDSNNIEVHDFNNLSVKNVIKEQQVLLSQQAPRTASLNQQQLSQYSSPKFTANLDKSTLIVANSSNSAIALYHLDNPISVLELIPIPNLPLPSPIPTKIQPASLPSPMNIGFPSPFSVFPGTPKNSQNLPFLSLSSFNNSSSPSSQNNNNNNTPANQNNSNNNNATFNANNPSPPLSSFSSSLKSLVISTSSLQNHNSKAPSSANNLMETYEALKLSSNLPHLVFVLAFLVDGRIIPILIDQDSLDLKLPELKYVSSQITSYNNNNNPDDSLTFMSDLEASNHKFSKSPFDLFKTPDRKASFNFLLSSLESNKGAFSLNASASANRSSIYHHKTIKKINGYRNRIQSMEGNNRINKATRDRSLSFEIDSLALLKELRNNTHNNRLLFVESNSNSIIADENSRTTKSVNDLKPMVSLTRESSPSSAEIEQIEFENTPENNQKSAVFDKKSKREDSFNSYRSISPSQFSPLRKKEQFTGCLIDSEHMGDKDDENNIMEDNIKKELKFVKDSKRKHKRNNSIDRRVKEMFSKAEICQQDMTDVSQSINAERTSEMTSINSHFLEGQTKEPIQEEEPLSSQSSSSSSLFQFQEQVSNPSQEFSFNEKEPEQFQKQQKEDILGSSRINLKNIRNNKTISNHNENNNYNNNNNHHHYSLLHMISLSNKPQGNIIDINNSMQQQQQAENNNERKNKTSIDCEVEEKQTSSLKKSSNILNSCSAILSSSKESIQIPHKDNSQEKIVDYYPCFRGRNNNNIFSDSPQNNNRQLNAPRQQEKSRPQVKSNSNLSKSPSLGNSISPARKQSKILRSISPQKKQQQTLKLSLHSIELHKQPSQEESKESNLTSIFHGGAQIANDLPKTIKSNNHQPTSEKQCSQKSLRQTQLPCISNNNNQQNNNNTSQLLTKRKATQLCSSSPFSSTSSPAIPSSEPRKLLHTS